MAMKPADLKAKPTPSVEQLHEAFLYDAETGLLTWRKTNSNRASAGTVAGSISALGYSHVRVFGERYPAHRLIWKMVHGVDPQGDIDHANGCRSDNRITNLRDCSRSQNHANRKPQRLVSKGAFCDPRTGRWYSRIVHSKVAYHLGTFATEQDAHAAYAAAASRLSGEFARAA